MAIALDEENTHLKKMQKIPGSVQSCPCCASAACNRSKDHPFHVVLKMIVSVWKSLWCLRECTLECWVKQGWQLRVFNVYMLCHSGERQKREVSIIR